MEAEDAWRLTERLHAEQGKGDPFAAAIRATRMPMAISDPRQGDNPIVFANEAFLGLTGYGREEVVGRNCRFLQGSDTDTATVERLREAVAARRDVSVDILNYRKNGEPFWNALYISPVINEAGELLFFFSSQLDVTDRKSGELTVRRQKEQFEREISDRTAELRAALAELALANDGLQKALKQKTVLLHEVDHRVKNNLQIIASLIALQMRRTTNGESAALKTTLRRVEALATVHRRLYQSENMDRFAAGAFLRDLVADLTDGVVGGVRVELQADDIEVPASKAAAFALLVNEALGGRLKSLPERDPQVRIALTCDGGEIAIEIASNAARKVEDALEPLILSALGRQLGATIEDVVSDVGPVARIRIAAE